MLRAARAQNACLALAAIAVLAACSTFGTKTAPGLKPAYGEFGLSTEWIDQSVKPGDDFYRRAVGQWESATEIPPDRASYGIDTIIADRVESDVREIAEAAALSTTAEGSIERKIGDFYTSYMDTAAIEAKGTAPLKARLDDIAVIKTKAALAKAFVDGIEAFGASPVSVFVAADAKDSDTVAVYLQQSGLGLPGRDHYLRRDQTSEDLRAAYRAYIERMLTLAGLPNAGVRAAGVLTLETRIAGVQWSTADSRDTVKTYNPKTLAELERGAPGIDWRTFAEALGLKDDQTLIVMQPSALAGIARLAAAADLETWKAYLSFHVLDQAAPFLPAAFDEANFAFRGKRLAGRNAQRERWRRAVRLLDSQLGQAVGQLYVAKRFPPATRAAALALVQTTKTAFRQLIDEAAWLDAATKAEARAKLDATRVKVGHPDAWRDYAALNVARDDLIGNVERGSRLEFRRNIARLGRPLDRNDWPLPPQTVDAFNDEAKNEVLFTAAILQPPYFDPLADPAVNYGAIGVVVGHELSHGFDDQGRKFDAAGKRRDWWTKKDADAYAAEADKLAAQFAAYESLPGLRVNGRLTSSENLAELAGLAIAYRAYKLSLAGKSAPRRDGLTGDQRFFLAYAQSAAAKRRDEALRQQTLSSPRAPERWRVNGAVRNFDPWYAAFGVGAGDALYLKPESRVRLWTSAPPAL